MTHGVSSNFEKVFGHTEQAILYFGRLPVCEIFSAGAVVSSILFSPTLRIVFEIVFRSFVAITKAQGLT